MTDRICSNAKGETYVSNLDLYKKSFLGGKKKGLDFSDTVYILAEITSFLRSKKKSLTSRITRHKQNFPLPSCLFKPRRNRLHTFLNWHAVCSPINFLFLWNWRFRWSPVEVLMPNIWAASCVINDSGALELCLHRKQPGKPPYVAVPVPVSEDDFEFCTRSTDLDASLFLMAFANSQRVCVRMAGIPPLVCSLVLIYSKSKDAWENIGNDLSGLARPARNPIITPHPCLDLGRASLPQSPAGSIASPTTLDADTLTDVKWQQSVIRYPKPCWVLKGRLCRCVDMAFAFGIKLL